LGEGDLIVQPWMHNRSGMFTADDVGDWARDAGNIADEGLAAFLEDMDEIRREAMAKRGETDEEI
jgi:hypothetical protein